MFLPFKEYKRHLPKNQRYQRIQTALKNENETKLQIAFLKNIAPLFQKYLPMFQTDGPMVHLIHHELKSLVRGTMERFVKKDAMIGASGKFSTNSLINVDLTKQENLHTLDKMDVGDGVRDILKKCKPSCRNENLKNMQAAFIAIASYFVENLPLSSQLLNGVMCLSPLLRKKSPPVHICRIAKHIPHVISEDSISLLRGEWSLYQTDDEIQKSWFVENDGSYKRLYHYFAKVF